VERRLSCLQICFHVDDVSRTADLKDERPFSWLCGRKLDLAHETELPHQSALKGDRSIEVSREISAS
jgi:hypothetical protein